MTERSGVQSIDRAVAILRCFDAHHAALGISDIARLTGLSTSTTHRLLGSMTANRLLNQGPDKRYRPGPLLVQLGRSGAVPSSLREAARPYMVALRDEVDETVGLHELLATYERAVVDQVESRQELRRHYTDIGVPIPLPNGAPGKAMLSTLPWARQQAALAQGIEPVTDKTVTDPEALAAELAIARERGWAGSDAERTPGDPRRGGPDLRPHRLGRRRARSLRADGADGRRPGRRARRPGRGGGVGRLRGAGRDPRGGRPATGAGPGAGAHGSRDVPARRPVP